MKKKIVIITIALMAFAVALAGNSWAAREKGAVRHTERGHRFQQTDQPVRDHFNRGDFRGRDDGRFSWRDVKRPAPNVRHRYDRRHYFRPAHGLKHKYYKRHHYRAPHRFQPKFRHWRHHPVYRHGHSRHFRW